MINFFGSENSILLQPLKSKLYDLFSDQMEIDVYIDGGGFLQSRSTSILILEEPPAVKPSLYRKNYLDRFDLVVHLSPWRARKYDSPYRIFQPLILSGRIKNPSKSFRYPVMILDHKFSTANTSLYSLRRDLLKYLYQRDIPCDLFGTNWNIPLSFEAQRRWGSIKESVPYVGLSGLREALSGFGRKYPMYKGWVENKNYITSKYSLAIVIENDVDSLSEKIFDCLLSGTVPIYVGPRLEQYTNLAPLCFQVDPDIQAIESKISSISDQEIREKEERIQEHLDVVDWYSDFSPSIISGDIAQAILNFVNSG